MIVSFDTRSFLESLSPDTLQKIVAALRQDRLLTTAVADNRPVEAVEGMEDDVIAISAHIGVASSIVREKLPPQPAVAIKPRELSRGNL